MATYDSMISRAVGGSDALVPEPLSNEIFQELPKQSAAMALMRKTQLSSKTQRLPVLDVLPTAYWVGGDTGLKQTSDQAWKGISLIVEELATIIPVPEAYLADADVPIWSEVQPRMVEAVGALIDSAVLWGVGKPSTWGTDIYTAAVAAGNTIKDGYVTPGGLTTTAATDFGQSVTALGDVMSQTGYSVNGFASRPGLNWRLIGLRSSQGVPIYQPDMMNGGGGNLYGYGLSMVENGSWDASKAQILAGDWSKAILGIRQDISFKMFTEGVISDDNGLVILNLLQQDAVAMRMTMRVAYATANPQTVLGQKAGKTITTRFPFGAILT